MNNLVILIFVVFMMIPASVGVIEIGRKLPLKNVVYSYLIIAITPIIGVGVYSFLTSLFPAEVIKNEGVHLSLLVTFVIMVPSVFFISGFRDVYGGRSLTALGYFFSVVIIEGVSFSVYSFLKTHMWDWMIVLFVVFAVGIIACYVSDFRRRSKAKT